MKRMQIGGKRQVLAIVAFASIIYLFAVVKLSVTFPWWDDYNAVLEPILKLKAASTVGERIAILTAQHNEHRIVFGKLVSYALYLVQGRVDFRALILIGNVGLLVLCAAVVAGARRTVASPVLLALVPLLLLTPIHGSHSLWAMACLTNYWVQAFAALALLLLSSGRRWSFPGACLFAAAATLTSGSGIICFGSGFLGLVLQRRLKHAVLWVALFLGLAAAYFSGYSRPPGIPPPALSLRAAVFFPTMLGAPVSDFLLRLFDPFRDLVGIEGHLIDLFRVVCGLGLIGIGGLLWVRGYHKRNVFLTTFVLYLTTICALGALARGGFDLRYALASQYFVITLSLAACLAVALGDSVLPPERISGAVVVASLVAWTAIWSVYYPVMRGFSHSLANSRLRFIEAQTAEAVVWGDTEEIRQRGFEILWQSYLTGLLPMKELHNPEGIELPLSTLRVIAAEDSHGPEPADTKSTAVTHFRQTGPQLALIPLNPASASDDEGTIYLRQGRLRYALPLAGTLPTANAPARVVGRVPGL